MQQQFGLTVSKGALVQEVGTGGPAAKAGMQNGDVVVAIDGHPITSPEDVIGVLRSHKPGDTLHVTYVRNGKSNTVDVTLTERPSS